MYYLSIQNSLFPNNLNLAIIKLLHKGSNRKNMGSYHLIDRSSNTGG